VSASEIKRLGLVFEGHAEEDISSVFPREVVSKNSSAEGQTPPEGSLPID